MTKAMLLPCILLAGCAAMNENQCRTSDWYEQGSVATKRKDVLKVLDARRLHPTEAQRTRVEVSTDLAQLDLWFDRSLTASAVDEVFEDED